MPKHPKVEDPSSIAPEFPGIIPRPDFNSKRNGELDQGSSELISRLARIGSALSAEKNINRLLEMIVDEAKKFTNANGGTLTDEERTIIESHAAITYGMLSQLPFPKKFRNVPFLASSHHEKLDGTGYPRGLKDEHLPLQARILALADIFEALTATDRPYRKGNTLIGAIQIMQRMVLDHHIDADLFDLFVREKIHLDYAGKELSDWQLGKPEH